MEQRSLRLGDIVDDYCPRERRVTNHVIVALVGDIIRQTRCSTCEAEHEYKEAKVPKKKLKGDAGSDLAGGILVAGKLAGNGKVQDPPEETAADPEAPAETASSPSSAQDGPSQDDEPSKNDEAAHDAWLAHRPLIRATLPRVEGEPPPARVIPEFTMHQRHGRGFGGRPFRHGHPPGSGGNGPSGREGNGPNGNRAPQPGKPGRRRRRRRPR